MQMCTKIVGLAATLGLALPAYAQQGTTERSEQPRASQQSQCLQNLGALAEQMNEDGYWLAGYRGYGVDAFGNPYARRAPVGGAPGAGSPAGTPAPEGEAGRAPPAPEADAGRPAGVRPSPWAGMTWPERPHNEIRILFRAANVLANRGNEEGCMTVLNAAEQRYNDYTSQLADVGVDPEEITTWRQAEIAAAVPVSDTTFPRRVDRMIGADIRNAADEDLGDVEDVVLDPGTGDIQYVLVSRGGFFGIGSDEVAVPWENLRVAPGMSTFVLPVSEEAMEQAPRVAREELVDSKQNEVQSYWEQALNR